MSNNLHLEEQLLWIIFAKKVEGEPEKLSMVLMLIQSAKELLLSIRDTFPTYTKHDETHSINVIRLMGELLGSRINDITALEGAILILSAYYHDIGMVYNEYERNSIDKESDFKKFLDQFPDYYVEWGKNNKVSEKMAEFYWRYRHPDRVFERINKIDDDKISWGSRPLKAPLGLVCKSHGYDINKLKDDNSFDNRYLAQADLKFCAILLRLADIIDFDSTRSPIEIYNSLNLKTKGKVISDTEWRKHLCSDGFNFKDFQEKGDDIIYIASPDDPYVEHEIRSFLDMIDNEFAKCSGMLSYCSDKWKDLSLPNKINRKDICGTNYKYGEHRFTLDQQGILDLLMGENLYNDPLVFIRELLQNAIDTTRFRELYETDPGYKPKIIVSQWYDDDKYQWIKIDDNGMGMDEDIINKYLLKVGKSYYNSNEFEAQKIKF